MPIEMEQYKEVVEKPEAFREWVDEMISRYPELFPAEIEQGYRLHDQRVSVKMPAIRLRRVKIWEADQEQVFTIAPSGVLPYMTGYTDEVEKALCHSSVHIPASWMPRRPPQNRVNEQP